MKKKVVRKNKKSSMKDTVVSQQDSRKKGAMDLYEGAPNELLSERELLVKGEISNLAKPTSGHFYFVLKDSSAQIRCAFFKNKNSFINFDLINGLSVLAKVRVGLYEGRGEYQLIVEDMWPWSRNNLIRSIKSTNDVFTITRLNRGVSQHLGSAVPIIKTKKLFKDTDLDDLRKTLYQFSKDGATGIKSTFGVRLTEPIQNEIRLAARNKEISVSDYIEQIHDAEIYKDFDYVKYIYDTNPVIRTFKLAYLRWDLLDIREKIVINAIRSKEDFWVSPVSYSDREKISGAVYPRLTDNYPKIITIVKNYTSVADVVNSKNKYTKSRDSFRSDRSRISSQQFHLSRLSSPKIKKIFDEKVIVRDFEKHTLDGLILNFSLTPFDEIIEGLYIEIFKILNALRLFLVLDEDTKEPTYFDELPQKSLDEAAKEIQGKFGKNPSKAIKVTALSYRYKEIYNEIYSLFSQAERILTDAEDSPV
tara:strand:- start:129 stop:1556 length:1428 start_codon:yes stop_codon:yes gene_type:complete